MEKQKLIYVESKALFSPSEVSDKAIVFIKDTKEIWTHGVYFSCSGTWASPITLSLTGDTTGSVSIDGSGNVSIATTTRYLSGMSSSSSDCNSAATTLPGNVTYYPCVLNSATNKFPTSNNANGILSLNVHDYSYTHLLGFSSNGNIYHRRRNGGTWETTWKTILNSSNYTNFPHTFASLTNKPTTISGYGITDCIPIISGGLVTTDTDLSTLGMTAAGAKLSVFHLYEGPYPTWLNVPYMNVLMFRSTSDSYGAIGIEMTGNHTVLFIGGRNAETTTNNVPNWWFRIKGASRTTYDLNSILNSINNLDSNYLRKSGGTMTGALNFANNTWNKVGDDAYMGDCNVAGMIGIKGANAATPGFAMYNDGGTLLGKLYASGTSLYWSDAKILTASGTSKLFVMGDGSLYSDTVSYTTWDKTTTSGIAWFPIADITDNGLGTALFMVRAYAHSSIIFTVVKGMTNGNINVLAGGGQFNNSYAYIRGVRLIGTVVEIGLNAAATYVSVVIKVLLPTFTYSLRSSLVESTNTATPYVQYDINSGGNNDFGIISSKFTGNLIGNADTASKWKDARTITLTGDVTGSVSLDGSSNVTLTTSTSGTGTTSFLKCIDKRNSYPALIVTSGGNIGAAFMSASKLGLSDGNYYDALILRGYANGSGGNENALLFSKNTSSVYHFQYAFGSTTTWGARYKFLDSGNYTNYTINNTKSGINHTGFAGIVIGNNLYHHSELSFASFAPYDNIGSTSYELIAELPNYDTGTNTTWITYGISGFMWSWRAGNCRNSSAYPITAIVTIGPSTGSRIRVPVTTGVLIPFIVKYNDKYYLALRETSSATNFYFMGQKLNLLTPTIKVTDPSLIEEIKGPETETSTAKYYYNNGTPQEYLHAGNYSSYALPLTGGTLTGKLIMLASNINTLPTIHRNHASYISGIRLENDSGYLGAIGMNAVNGSLYILDTANTTYTILDSRNYNNYSPTLAGKGASGTWAINISGVAASASKVANALTLLLNGGTTSGTNKFVYDGSSAYTINITPGSIGAAASSHTHDYLPLSGGTMSANGYIAFPASANSSALGNSTPMGITYGRIHSYGTLTIAGDTDASKTEFVNIVAGRNISQATAANGLSIGYNTLKWQGTDISLAGHNHDGSYLKLAGGTLGSSSASVTELRTLSSTAALRIMSYSDSTNYILSSNSAFTGNATLKITGYNNVTGTNLHFKFNNIYCRDNGYINIDSGNYNSYALPLSGGTLTGTLISRDIRPSANVSYSLGTSSYYYNYVYAKYFKKKDSSDSYVLLGGGGHKAVSDFTMKELKTTTSISGNTDQWSIILEQSYPADHWYDIVNTFLVEGTQFGSGFLSFYANWLATSSAFNDYITEVYFNGTMRGETTAAFGGSNRDINDYLRIYIDKTNYKLLVYVNHYSGKTVRIKRINYNEIGTSGFPNGGILVEHFNDKGTIVSLPTESSTMTRVLIKTHYNHDRTIKTSKSIYASSFYENSDIRLKENIRGIDLSDLTKLVDLVQFNFKDSDTKKYGVIAQLLELVGLQNLVYENDGKKAVDYISLLVLEIQRLRNEIGELKLEINKKS